ncbi:MAG TPA: hypothetical protein VLX58_13570 [Bryobacteraceae bacterium]|nr:hypothetical protein [Bryobacteraceae bacterium]
MFGGCPVDRNVFFCVLRYQPDLVLLFVLAFVCICCLWKFMDSGAPAP